MLQLGHTTVGYVMMQMVVAHGGRCSERLIFGDISDGGQDDLARISSVRHFLQEDRMQSLRCSIMTLLPKPCSYSYIILSDLRRTQLELKNDGRISAIETKEVVFFL